MLPILNPVEDVEDVEDGQAYLECKTVVCLFVETSKSTGSTLPSTVLSHCNATLNSDLLQKKKMYSNNMLLIKKATYM